MILRGLELKYNRSFGFIFDKFGKGIWILRFRVLFIRRFLFVAFGNLKGRN